ncbi:MAG TPA: serine/threonine-protein kinase, partial [Blastocatellia bacterium]
MTPDRWKRIEEIFEAASGLDGAGLAVYLDQACGGDQAMREEVESLLACMNIPVSILDNPLEKDGFRLLAAGQDGPLAGRTINQYKIIAPLGAGGMGEVYLAQDTLLGRKVALKLLPSALAGDADLVRRLWQEARAASALNHPNIITIHEIGRTDRLPFIATEFVHGETLRQQMRGSRMSVCEALSVAIQVCGALAAAHRAGIVHRDIKPENIMLRDDGYAKVLDFGIAELREAQAPASQADAEMEPGAGPDGIALIGTVSYMSPEQARGERLDARTDLFSLGVVLYEMVTGRRPFEGETDADVLHALLNNEPPPLDTLRHGAPLALAGVINKALMKHRDERYRSAGEMLADLGRLKYRLEQRRGGEDSEHSTATPAPSGALPSALITTELANDIAVMATARPYAKYYLMAGTAAAIVAVLDVLLVRHQPGWVDWALLVVTVTGVLAFVYLRRQVMLRAPASYREGGFRGLLPFQEGDQEHFYGREKDT